MRCQISKKASGFVHRATRTHNGTNITFNTALDALATLANTAKLALDSEEEHAIAIAAPTLDVLRKDYLSLLTLIYTSTTKVSLVLRPSEPAYKASLPPVADLTKHISSLATCTALFGEHGLILAKEVRRHTDSLIENVRSLARTLCKQDDPLDKEYLVRTGAVHDAVEQIRKQLPLDNNAAVQKRLVGDRDLLADCLEEIQEMVKERNDEVGDDDDWGEDSLDELGLGSSKPLSATELSRAKRVRYYLLSQLIGLHILLQCGELMRWTCALHKKILRDFQSRAFSALPTTSTDLLPEHSHSLLLAAEDLVASLYAPQDPTIVLQAVNSIDDKFQTFRKTLFDVPRDITANGVQAIENKINKLTVNETAASLPHGYETSFRVLATCISKALEETPPPK